MACCSVKCTKCCVCMSYFKKSVDKINMYSHIKHDYLSSNLSYSVNERVIYEFPLLYPLNQLNFCNSFFYHKLVITDEVFSCEYKLLFPSCNALLFLLDKEIYACPESTSTLNFCLFFFTNNIKHIWHIPPCNTKK